MGLQWKIEYVLHAITVCRENIYQHYVVIPPLREILTNVCHVDHVQLINTYQAGVTGMVSYLIRTLDSAHRVVIALLVNISPCRAMVVVQSWTLDVKTVLVVALVNTSVNRAMG